MFAFLALQQELDSIDSAGLDPKIDLDTISVLALNEIGYAHDIWSQLRAEPGSMKVSRMDEVRPSFARLQVGG
jgi:hypothetical protein